MGDPRWLRIGLLAAWFAADQACVSHDDSCGGPTSDFPVCGEDRAPDDSASGGSEPPAPVNPDAGAIGSDDSDAGGGDASADGGLDCSPIPIVCDGATTALDVSGQSPAGAVKVLGVALNYVSGAQERTLLSFEATIAGQPEPILAVPFVLSSTALLAPGTYPGAGSKSLFVGVGCLLDPEELSATMEVFEHTKVSVAAGDTGVLRGELRVLEPDWDLTVPFEIHQACRQVVQTPPSP